MENGTPNGETGNPEAPKNGTQTQAPNTGNAGDSANTAEKERLRKELEQAKMSTNQLEREKKAREDAEAAAEAKKLEEQNEFKTLHEQEKAKREALEAQIRADSERIELEKAKSEIIKDYSEEVKALAEEAGMSLTSADDDVKQAFKGKLDKIQAMVGANGKPGPNNPGVRNPKPGTTTAELSKDLKNPAKFEEHMRNLPGVSTMMGKQ